MPDSTRLTPLDMKKQIDQLSAVLVAILRTTGPITIPKKEAERQMQAGDTLHYDRHDDGMLTVRVASVREQDAAASDVQSHVSTPLPVERPVSVEQNEEDVAK